MEHVRHKIERSNPYEIKGIIDEFTIQESRSLFDIPISLVNISYLFRIRSNSSSKPYFDLTMHIDKTMTNAP